MKAGVQFGVGVLGCSRFSHSKSLAGKGKKEDKAEWENGDHKFRVFGLPAL